MKKLIVPVTMIVLIVAFCSVCVWFTEKTSLETVALLEEAERLAELRDYGGAASLTRESRRLWESREGFLGMVLRHTESDEICYMYPPLMDCCNAHDLEEYRRRNHELQAYLRQLSRMEIPYYFNIL